MINWAKYFIPLMPFLLGGVMLDVIPLWALVVIFIAYFILFLTRHEKAVVCAFVLCKLLGYFCTLLGVPVPGSIISLGLLVLFLGSDTLLVFNNINHKRPVIFILATFIILVIFYALGGETEYSGTKIYRTLISLLVDSIGFLLIVQFDDINLGRVGPMLFLESLILICFTMSSFGIYHFTSLLDFDAYRETFIELRKMDVYTLTYHTTGIASFIAAAFYLCDKKSLTSVYDYIFILTCAWAIMVSGARQAVFGFVLLIGLWLSYRKGQFSLPLILVSIVMVLGAILFIQSLELETYQNVFESGNDIDATLSRNFEYPVQLIEQNPWFGIGFGNYFNPHSTEIYPHNLILEMLCEFGFIGSLVLLIPVVWYFVFGYVQWKNIFGNGAVSVYLIFPFFVRSMISSDISENIALFCAFFILFYAGYGIDIDDDEEETEDDSEVDNSWLTYNT